MTLCEIVMWIEWTLFKSGIVESLFSEKILFSKFTGFTVNSVKYSKFKLSPKHAWCTVTPAHLRARDSFLMAYGTRVLCQYRTELLSCGFMWLTGPLYWNLLNFTVKISDFLLICRITRNPLQQFSLKFQNMHARTYTKTLYTGCIQEKSNFGDMEGQYLL